MRYPKLNGSITIGGIAFDYRMAVVLWVTTVVELIYAYHGQFLATWLQPLGLENYVRGAAGIAYNQLALFFVAPVIFILLMGDSPCSYGLRLGKWKEGLVWLLVVCPAIFIGLIILVRHGSQLERMYAHAYTDRMPGGSSPLMQQAKTIYNTGVLLFGWEFLLRGFCLFGLARVLGPGPAIFIQMVPFSLMHIGKAELETMTTWLSGVGFGFVAWRTESFLYGFLIHWFMLVMVILIAGGTIHF